MCRETRCGFKDIEVQKRMLRKELSSIVDDDDKMGYDDFEFALTQLMNFVGVIHTDPSKFETEHKFSCISVAMLAQAIFGSRPYMLEGCDLGLKCLLWSGLAPTKWAAYPPPSRGATPL